MKQKKIILLVLLIITAILAITNPSKESHVATVTKNAEQIFGEQFVDSLQNDLVGSIKGMLSEDDLKGLEGFFGKKNVELAEKYLEESNPEIAELVNRRNYFLFSLTQVEVAGISQTIGIGILGGVYILA